MIVHLKTSNLSLCLNHEYLKSVIQKYLKLITENYIYEWFLFVHNFSMIVNF